MVLLTFVKSIIELFHPRLASANRRRRVTRRLCALAIETTRDEADLLLYAESDNLTKTICNENVIIMRAFDRRNEITRVEMR
jgi:hypothetical protein